MDTSVNLSITSIGSDPSHELQIEIGGQTDLPDVGLCAADGSQLEALVTGVSPEDMQAATYQWATLETGDIAGATDATYTVAAAGMDLNRLCVTVNTPGAGEVSSSFVTIRHTPPQVQMPLADIVFDFESGVQDLDVTTAFNGDELLYAVSATHATIDAATGLLSVHTDTVVEDALITVQATNSGGTVSTEFHVSVEDVPDTGDVDTVMFGALTATGAGGVPVSGATIASGDASGHWQIAGGELSPSGAGQAAELASAPYELLLDDGTRIDVLVADDMAHARPTQTEVLAAYAALPGSGGKLLIRDGDDQLSPRWVFPARTFTGPCVIEPAEWEEDPDPRQSMRDCKVPGITLSKGTENVTLQGFDIFDDGTHGEGEGTTSVVHVPRPTLNVTVRQNRIHSRDFVEIWTADDFRANFSTANILRGVSMNESSSTGDNVNIRIDDNWMHDLGRGAYLIKTKDGPNGERSSFNRNLIEDCYTNFVTAGYLDGIDIIDNRAMHIWAANEDTLTPENIYTVPHASLLGFDVDGSYSTQNINLFGNLMHVGWRRTKLHRDNSLPDPAIKATGAKWNDPKGPNAYYNIVAAFNLIVSHGLCMEFSGCDTVDCFNNTLLTETYNSAESGSLPIYYFAGVSNTRFWNNLGQSTLVGAEDDTGDIFPRSLDGISGYGYQRVNSDDFMGINGKGLDLLTLDELSIAYQPKADHYALTSSAMKGALGTSLYAGNGVHSVGFTPPVSSSAPSSETREVFFDGGAYLEGGSIGENTKQFTFAARYRCHADDDGVSTSLYSSSGAALNIFKLPSGQLQLKIKKVGETSSNLAVQINSSVRIDSPKGWTDIFVSLDVERGIVQMAFDGVFDPMVNIYRLENEVLDFSQYLARIGRSVLSSPANAQVCGMGQFLLNNSFVDLEDPVEYSTVFASDGSFAEWGPDAGGLTGGLRPLIYMTGDRTSYINRGRGGAFIRTGLLQDVGTRDFDVSRIQGLYLTASTPGLAIAHADVAQVGRLHIMARPLQTSSVPAPQKIEVRDGYWDGAPAAFKQVVDVTSPGELILPDISLPSDQGAYTAYEIFFMSEDPVTGLLGEVFERTFTMPPTGDLTVPVIDTAVASDTGNGLWSVDVNTDTGEGVLSVVLTSFATVPTAQQVVAGENHLGETQPAFVEGTVTAAGPQSVDFLGLAPSTLYYAHAVHTDAAGNVSAVISSPSFTTSAGAVGVTQISEGYTASAATEVGETMRTLIVAFPIQISNLSQNWAFLSSSTSIGSQSAMSMLSGGSSYYTKVVTSSGASVVNVETSTVISEGIWSNVALIVTPNRQEFLIDGQTVVLQSDPSVAFKALREVSGPPAGSGIVAYSKGVRIYGTNDASLDAAALAVVAGDVFDSDGFANDDPDIRGIPLLWSE